MPFTVDGLDHKFVKHPRYWFHDDTVGIRIEDTRVQVYLGRLPAQCTAFNSLFLGASEVNERHENPSLFRKSDFEGRPMYRLASLAVTELLPFLDLFEPVN